MILHYDRYGDRARESVGLNRAAGFPGDPRASCPGRTASLKQFLAELRLVDPDRKKDRNKCQGQKNVRIYRVQYGERRFSELGLH